MVKTSFFRTLEINQILVTIWGALIKKKKKWLSLGKNWKPCGISTCPIPVRFSPFYTRFLKSSLTIIMKTSSLAITRWAELLWTSPRAPHSGNCHSLTCLAARWKHHPPPELVFIFLHPELTQCKQLFPQKYLSNYLTLQLCACPVFPSRVDIRRR